MWFSFPIIWKIHFYIFLVRRDYDRWAELGNYGWSFNDILPYFKKVENVKIPSLRYSPWRGNSGYLDIEYAPYTSPLHGSFREAGYELGYDYNDPNGENLMGFSLAQATMRNGRRLSAAKAYLRSVAAKRENLHISMSSWVTKIIIDPFTKTALGVEFLKNRKRYFIKAKKEVILSAGTIGSAQLLLLSGNYITVIYSIDFKYSASNFLFCIFKASDQKNIYKNSTYRFIRT